MNHIITLPCQRRVTLGQYCNAIRVCKSMQAAHGDQYVIRHGQWDHFDSTPNGVIRDFGRMVTDRCNRGLTIREYTATHALRNAKRRGRDCRWCGTHFTPTSINDRTCSDSCARSLMH